MKIRTMALCVLAGACGLTRAQIAAATLSAANADLQAGKADQALSLLTPLPTTGTGADVAQNLLCRVRFTLEQWATAAAECQQAINLSAKNSDYFMWLGRVLGQQASHASFLTAYGDAKKSLSAMQSAVTLNPQNVPALMDLGDYYARAPGIAGGGSDKAQAIASQLDKVDAAQAQHLRADIAMAGKNYLTAENEYKQAISLSPAPADLWTLLADLYRGQKRWSDLDAAIQSCIAAAAKDRNSAVAYFDGAGVLIAAKRNPSLAATMLEDYLSSPAMTEEAPAFIAHIRLSRLKQQLGDAAGAQSELAAAAAMAKEFEPSQDPTH